MFLTSVSDSWARLPVGNKHLFESLGHSRENQSAGSEAESGIRGLTGRRYQAHHGVCKENEGQEEVWASSQDMALHPPGVSAQSLALSLFPGL